MDRESSLGMQHRGIRISGDGSRVVYIDRDYICAWSLQTREFVGKGWLENNSCHFDPLQMGSSKFLVQSGKSSTQGWDFGVPGSTPIQLSETSSSRPRLNLVDVRWWTENSPVRIEDSVTGKEVFQLYGKYAQPTAIQWDGQYLIAGYRSGEVLILDFKHVLA